MISSDSVSGRTVAVAAVAAAGAAVLGVAVARKLLEEKIPAESDWRRVGTLKELYLFPLKSGKPVRTDRLMAEEAGPTMGSLRDRSFVAVDRTGRFVSGRTHPGLLTVSITAVDQGKDDGLLELSSSRVDKPLVLDTNQLKAFTRRKITVWGNTVSAVDCGDEAAAFIRRAAVDAGVHAEASPAAELRLAYFPLQRTDRGPKEPRGVNGIYTDQSSYHALNSSSIDALNEKLQSPVSALHFRPNFVIDGPAAFADDEWQWMKIGQAVFKIVMPCGRCILTTVDPETGVKSLESEPLATLRKFRKPTPAQKTAMKGSEAPVMGNRVGIVRQGEINLNDDVYVFP